MYRKILFHTRSAVRRAALFGCLCFALYATAEEISFQGTLSSGQPVSMTASAKRFQNISYVPLSSLMAPLGGTVQINAAKVQVQLERSSASASLNDVSVNTGTTQFLLAHPILSEAGAPYISLEDAAAFMKQGFQVSLTQAVVREDPVLTPSSPAEAAVEERAEELLTPMEGTAAPLTPPGTAEASLADPEAQQAAAPPISVTTPAEQSPSSPLPAPPVENERPPMVAEGPVTLIVLDAGHGGNDGGATGEGGLEEKKVVLSLTQKVGERLRAHGGLTVLMTRTEDRAFSAGERAAVANKARAGLVVSLHTGATPGKRMPELQVFHGVMPENGGDEATLANRAQHMGATLVQALSAGDDAPSAALYVAPLRLQTILAMPYLLVEVGVLNTQEGEALLQDEAHMNQLADRLATAIIAAAS